MFVFLTAILLPALLLLALHYGKGALREGALRFTARPALEALEDRFLPASTSWMFNGMGAGDWNTPANWTNGVPTPHTDVIFSAQTGSCTLTVGQGLTPSVMSLTLSPNYAGTLTLNNGLDVYGALTLRSGNISQPNGSASDIWTYSLDWAGAVLNNAPTVSTLHIGSSGGGGTSTISSPLGGGDLTTGDNISVEYTHTLTSSQSGNLNFVNSAGMTVQSGGQVILTGNGTLAAPQGSRGFIDNFGSFGKNAGNGKSVSQLPLVNDGPNAFLAVQGNGNTLAFTTASPLNGVSVFQNNGITSLNAGTTLEVDAGFTMNAGTLQTAGAGAFAEITRGDVKVHGGDIWIAVTGGTASLICDGFVTMDGGTYHAGVDATALKADDWTASKGFSLSNTATLDVVTFNIPQGGVPKNKNFTILDVATGQHITGEFGTKDTTYSGGGLEREKQ